VKYPCFRLSQGRTALANHKDDGDNPFAAVAPEYRSASGELDADDIDEILGDIRRSAGLEQADELRSSGMTPDQVEGKVGFDLYSSFLEFPPEALGDPDFWRYIAVEVLRDFVFWRDGDDCSLASFGLASSRRIPDCVPLRMFNRAHIASSTEALEEQARIGMAGGADFWQSHVLRVQNRYDPRITQDLAAAMNSGAIPNVQVLRQVAKDIRRLRANLILELQDDQTLDATLATIVRDVNGHGKASGVAESPA